MFGGWPNPKRMENLEISKTAQSPRVHFNPNGNLIIEGVSTINYAHKFYAELISWLHDFRKTQPENINLVLELYYLNTSSSLLIVELLRLINTFKEIDSKLIIEWRYEEDDEDIFNLGEDIEASTNSKFVYVMI